MRRIRAERAGEASLKRQRARRWTAWLLVPLIIVSAYAARGRLLPLVARFLDVSTAPVAADSCMVLGGGNDTRPFLAAALLRHGLATQVIVARSAPSLDTQDGMVPSEDEVVARVLAHQGISAGHLVRLPGACTSTRDEARALAGFLREHPGVRVTVVTSSYHTRRARRVFRRALGAEASRIAFLGAPTEGFGPTDWWQCRDGFGTYMNELGKMAYDLVRY